MSKTLDDLSIAIALDLDIIETGDALSDEDAETLQTRCRTQIADLNARKVAYIPNVDQIPTGFSKDLSTSSESGSGRATAGNRHHRST
jgi:hypothetical protein